MRIAVLGLGRMGVPIVERLELAGHELCVWNRSAAPMQAFVERGIRGLKHPADAWQHADVCITMLADGRALSDVTSGEHGLLAGDRGGVLIDMSTISAQTSAAVAGPARATGLRSSARR